LGYFINEVLSENKIKFVSACIIQSLKYIRHYKIIHRDLNYLNVMMDNKYYFNLIDFSYSVDFDKRKSKYLKCNGNDNNTPPEIRNNSEYSYNSDYFRLGNLIFFLVFKKYPWNLKQINNKTELIEIKNIKKNYSAELFDFINGLIKENIYERLGYKDINEIINHPWFKGFNWKKLEKRKIISPFINSKIKINIPFCRKFNKRLEKIYNYLQIRKSIYNSNLIKLFDYSKYDTFN